MARRLYLPDGCLVPWYNPVRLDPNGTGLSCIGVGQEGWYELQVDERGKFVGMNEEGMLPCVPSRVPGSDPVILGVGHDPNSVTGVCQPTWNIATFAAGLSC